MIAKLSNIVRELLLVKKECISIMSIEKIDAYQNNWNCWKDLSLLEQLNVKCNNEAKNLITNAI